MTDQYDSSNLTEGVATRLLCPILSRGAPTSCLGSSCMAWRWFNPEFERRPAVPGKLREDGSYRVQRQFAKLEDAVSPEDDGLGPWTFTPLNEKSEIGDWRRPMKERRRGFCGAFEPRVAEVECGS